MAKKNQRKKPDSQSSKDNPLQKGKKAESREEQIARFTKMVGDCPRAWAAVRCLTSAIKSSGKDSEEARLASANLNKLIQKSKERGDPTAPVAHELSPQDPRDPDAANARREIHLDLLTSGMYAKMMQMAGGHSCSVQGGAYEEFLATSLLYAQDVLRRMQPRDDMEAMLISQALWTHARIAHLNNHLLEERNIDLVKSLNESIDRAQNAYRRQMTALAEYRRPPKAAGVYNRIEQANIANQQIVRNGARKRAKPRKARNEKPTNELGSPNEPKTVQAETKLSPKRRGPSLA